MSINHMGLLLDFTQPNLKFEPSFVEINKVLRKIRLFEQLETLANFAFLGVSNLSTNCS